MTNFGNSQTSFSQKAGMGAPGSSFSAPGPHAPHQQQWLRSASPLPSSPPVSRPPGAWASERRRAPRPPPELAVRESLNRYFLWSCWPLGQFAYLVRRDVFRVFREWAVAACCSCPAHDPSPVPHVSLQEGLLEVTDQGPRRLCRSRCGA